MLEISYDTDDRYGDKTSFDQKTRSMLVKLEQLGVFSLCETVQQNG